MYITSLVYPYDATDKTQTSKIYYLLVIIVIYFLQIAAINNWHY